ncbi:MAG: amidohydrolase family protein [Alphaproteobacteria bacterium]|nr:amidohydrolase family protein [Alphaproteobacteria bacterium]
MALPVREEMMPTIDSDAHVIETPATWGYMEGPDLVHRPVTISTPAGEAVEGRPQPQTEFWGIDGRMIERERNIGLETDRGARELSDIEKRLAHMDELTIDVQVLYPSLWLRPITRKPAVELALIRSYNRWLADIWKAGAGRLRWVALAPLLSLDDPGLVRDELAAAKETGACGVFMCGLACDRQLTDSYFFPLYEIAQELDLPICLHAGNDSRAVHDFFLYADGLSKFKMPVIGAFHSLLMQEVPARFPDLRWAFVETGSAWVPYVLGELGRRFKRRGKRFSDDPMGDNNFYVACQVNEDIEYIAGVAGRDHLVVGTDYGHHDTSTEIEAMRLMKEKSNIAPELIDNILGANACALYGLEA